MRIGSLALLAVVLGIGLGYAGTVVEFGAVTPPPRLVDSGVRSAEIPQLSPPAAGQPLPRVQIAQVEHNFGTMGLDGSGSHTFEFRNVGDGPLRLKVGDPPCKCTVGALSKEVLAPGETSQVTVDYHPGGEQGQFHRTVPIHTNDPARQLVRLVISGQVTPIIRTVPAQILAYNLPLKEPRTFTAMLYALRNEDLAVTGYGFEDASLAEFFEVSSEPAPRSEWHEESALAAWRVEVTVLPGLPLGRFSQGLLLETNDPDRPTVTIEILGNVSPEISVAGSGFDSLNNVLTFGTVRRAEGAQRSLSVLIRGDNPQEVRLQVDRTVPESLEVTLGEPQPVGGGALVRVPLQIRVPPNAEEGSYFGIDRSGMGRVVLTSNLPQQPEVEIHVRLVIGP